MARKLKRFDWTLSHAQAEFGLDHHTLKRKLSETGQSPDAKGHFTTRQICIAIFGDLRGEQTKLVSAQLEERRLKIEERKGKLISIEDAEAACGRAATAIRQRIVNSQLPRDEKNALLVEINGLREIDFARLDKILAEEEERTEGPPDGG